MTTTTRPPSDRGQGRKPVPDQDRLIVGSVRLTKADWEKFKRLGGIDWMRGKIARARPPANAQR